MSPTYPPARIQTQIVDLLHSSGILLILFALMKGPIVLWRIGGWGVSPSGSRTALAGILCLFTAQLIFQLRGGRPRLHPSIFIAGLCILPFTDWFARPFGFMISEATRGELLVCSAFSYFLLRAGPRKTLSVLALVAPILLCWTFFGEAQGNLLFSDDHATELYRLESLKQNFPLIPHYNPLWNAGLDARDYFATGVLNLFFLLYPLIMLLPLEFSYNYLIAIVFLIGSPLAMYFASRLTFRSRLVAACAALLGSSSSFLLFRWALKYGSMGFVTSCILAPLNLAVVCKLLNEGQPRKRDWLVYFISISLMLCWTPTSIAFIPLALYGLVRWRVFFKKRFSVLFLCTLLIVNASWMLLFVSVSKVDKFVSLQASSTQTRTQTATPKSADTSKLAVRNSGRIDNSQQLDSRVVRSTHNKTGIASAIKNFREWVSMTNPLLLFLALPAIALLKNIVFKRALIAISLWLFYLGTFAANSIPQLELERMLIIAGQILCIPVAHLLAQLIRQFSQNDRSLWKKCGTSVALAYLLCSLFLCAGFIRRRSYEYYWFGDTTLVEMKSAINKFAGPGRVVFPGFMLHQLSGGHLAPLVYLTSKPLVASSPFHNLWQYKELVPQVYLDRGSYGIEEYLTLMNASAVIVYQKEWKDYFNGSAKKNKKLQLYRVVWGHSGFLMFTRKQKSPSYFLEGKGELLQQDSSSINLRIDSKEAVLKFNYFPFLVSNSCELAPKIIPGGIELIALSKCDPGTVVRIQAGAPWQRLFR